MQNIPVKTAQQAIIQDANDNWAVKGADYNVIRAKLAEIIVELGGDDTSYAELLAQVGALETASAMYADNAGSQTLAAAGANQGNAGTIAFSGMTLITGADGTKGVKLPVLETGRVYFLVNQSATSSVKVYPILGGNFLGVAENGSVTLNAGGILMVVDYDGTQWAYVEYVGGIAVPKAYKAFLTQALISSTSGVLVVGKSYTITTFEAGDDFVNVGAASNGNGITFTATDVTPTVWANGSLLTNNTNSAPTASVLADNITPTLSRTATGTYRVTKTGAFTSGKTIPGKLVAYIDADGNLITAEWKSVDYIEIKTYAAADITVLADGVLSNQYFEILIYS